VLPEDLTKGLIECTIPGQGSPVSTETDEMQIGQGDVLALCRSTPAEVRGQVEVQSWKSKYGP